MNAPSSVRPDTSGIEVSSFRVEELAGLVRMCGECIYKELVSIGRFPSRRPAPHSQSVIDQIDTPGRHPLRDCRQDPRAMLKH